MSQPSNEHIEDVLAQDGVWISTTVGISMWPMLRNRRDTIVVRPCKSQLQKYDVALYRRGDAYVLHRVIGVKENSYRILGDNCRADECVPKSAVIGKLDEFWRGDKHCNPRSHTWLAYARVWLAIWPLRRFVSRARAAVNKVAKAVRR